jgi:hypothetical protein
MDLNTKPSGCVKVYADLLRKTTRLLTEGIPCTGQFPLLFFPLLDIPFLVLAYKNTSFVKCLS